MTCSAVSYATRFAVPVQLVAVANAIHFSSGFCGTKEDAVRLKEKLLVIYLAPHP